MTDFLWLINSVYAHFIKIPLVIISVIFLVLLLVVAVLVIKALGREKRND